MKRRNFIKLSLFCAMSLITPLDLKAKKLNKKTLVLIELDGGNDGLNTFVPYSSKNYYNLRPNIAIKKEDLNIINKDFGLNKNLSHLYKLYKEKNLAIINGLGYEKANLSHFKSIQIVETGGDGIRRVNEGWISSYLRQFDISELRPANALLIGKRKRGHLFSKDLTILQIKNINSFVKKANSLNISTSNVSSSTSLDFLQKEEKSLHNAAKSLDKYTKDVKTKNRFSSSTLSMDFEEAFKIIKSSLDIPVLKISHKGYDTHSNQKQRQSELLKELDTSLESFINELKSENLFDDVLIMTYSEFGRRVKENASLGTDHGTASVQFVLGGSIKGGVYENSPSLVNMKKNNLLYTCDYKSLYNTILSRWFNYKENSFSNFKTINFI